MHLGNSKPGQALIVLILLVMVVITTIAAGLAAINRTNTQTLTNQVRTTQAIYVAQAGIEDACYELRQSSTWRVGFSDKVFPSGSTSTYTVTVSGALPDLTLTSIGTVGGISRTIVVGLSVLASPLDASSQTAPFVIATNTWDETDF